MTVMFASMLVAIALMATILICANDWRRAMPMILVVGFIQDPIRKLVPGEPVILVVAVIGVTGLVFALAFMQIRRLSIESLFSGNPNLINLFRLYLAMIVVQAIQTAVFRQSPILGGLGLIAYFSPIVAIWLAANYPRSLEDILRFLRIYTVLTSIFAAGILLSYAGVEWGALAEVGSGLRIYDQYQKSYIVGHSGFMRSVEVAAWHAGAGACALLIFAVRSRHISKRAILCALALCLVAVGLMTGRRKVLMLVTLFIGLYGLQALYFSNRHFRRSVATAIALLILVVGAFLSFQPYFDNSQFAPYLLRGGTGFGDAFDRFTQTGINLFLSGWYRGGMLGIGAGAGATGAQHFGGGLVGGAAEGGMGKIIVELGAIGFVVAILLLVVLAFYLVRVIVIVNRLDPAAGEIGMGLLAFLAANVAIFTSAAQVYGDPFVLLLLGLWLGFILAMPRILFERYRRTERRPAARMVVRPIDRATSPTT